MEGLAEYTSAACKPRRDAGSQGTETGIEEGSSGEVSSPACEPRFESLNAPHIAPKAASTSSNSVVVLPQWKSKKLVYLNLGLLVSAVILVLASSHLKFMPLNNWLGLSKFIQNDSESKAKASNLTRVLPVVTQKVVPVDSYQLSRIYTGSLVARRKSVLGFDRSGKLVKVAVEEGDRVLSGQPLAYLDTRNLKAERRGLLAKRVQAMAKLEEMEAGVRPETIAAAQASVKDLNEQLELARQKSSRRAKLYAQGAISLEQMDEAANQANVTLARLEEAQSKLDELLAGTRSEQIKAQKGVVEEIDASLVDLDVKLDQSIIKAPFAGIISARQVDEGTVVAAGESILHLIERGALEARVGIPVKAASLISVGSYQSLRIGSKTYPARVTAILPELDTQTRTMTVVLALEESLETKVKSGQVVRLKLSEQIAQSGYWLPTTSLVQGTHGLWSCYVLGKSTASDNTFSVEPRDVEILHTESDRVLVRGSLQANEQVVVNGIHRLFPGQLVKPVDERA
jgi:multidrug efflux pump subunit AcrA (membrane-fusion protein)